MKKWYLELKSGAMLPVKDENVDKVKATIAEKKPIITKSDGIIQYWDIENFDQYEDSLEDASRAMGTPVLVEVDGETKVSTRAVKKRVSHREYQKYSSYRTLSNDSDGVTIAWWQPVHLITSNMQECTPEEIEQLKKR